ncbi:MAG TPA: chemotaxis protein CheB [Polyangiaceae bacterium]
MDTPDSNPEPRSDGPTAGPSFPIVGIGASAGGLEALTALVGALTLDTMAFVVVQHQSPDHESMLSGILGRATRMSVQPIADGMTVEKNHIYVSPPNATVAILHGVLHLMPRSANLPIDAFFRSLAEDHGSKAVGVVLSGMGSDGTNGLKEIRAGGGLTFCQEPSTAKFDSMPRSALESGAALRALRPEDIGAELMTLGKHAFLARNAAAQSTPLEREELAKLFILIRSEFGNDLTLYKPSSINRRVERRMALLKIDKLADYVKHAHDDRDELASLYKDILINVTSFFRDGEPFDVVKNLILPRIIERKAPRGTLRFWVPACASGEEAYSLGMCLLESLERRPAEFRIQIFGTDVDVQAIARARRGIYPQSIEADVSTERLDRFFVKVGKDYQVSRQLRDLIVFSPQNVTKDSPFSRIDLLSCRNLLIYLQPPLQKKVLRLLHYALEPDGYLLLGTSETVGDSADLFSLVDRTNKIYMKKNLPLPALLHERGVEAEAARRPDSERRLNAQQVADRKLLERYVPASVLVDENLDVLQFRGDTGLYLSPAAGAATLNLMKLVRPELHVEIWRAIQQATETNASVQVTPVRVQREGDLVHLVGLEVVPIVDQESRARCFLVIFTGSAPIPASTSGPPRAPDGSKPPPGGQGAVDQEPAARVRDLEHDLASTREYLQTTIEELETSNEELKSTNEELQSSNEELQSTNEELETSKEELQATNEELSTTNDELQHRVSDLWRSTTDLDNLMSSVDQAIVFVDASLRLRAATDAAQKLLRLDERWTGRPVADLAMLFGGTDVVRLARTSISRLVPMNDQARVDGRWYDVRAVPYRSPGGVVDGAILILRDAGQRGHELVLDVRAYAEKLLAALPQPLAIVDAGLHVLWVNAPFLEAIGNEPQESLRAAKQSDRGLWAHPGLRQAMIEALATDKPFRDLRIEGDFGVGGRQVMLVSGTVLTGVGGADRVLLLAIVPIEGTNQPPPKGG